VLASGENIQLLKQKGTVEALLEPYEVMICFLRVLVDEPKGESSGHGRRVAGA